MSKISLAATPSDLIHVADNGSDETLIVFSHRGASSFLFYRTVAHLTCNKVFIRDPTDEWYNSGVPGVAASATELAVFLRGVIAGLKSKRLYTLGASMGGYAAILFGVLLGADRVVAFSPQTILDSVFPLSPKSGQPGAFPDLLPLVRQAPSTQVDVLVGANELTDLFYAAHLAAFPSVRSLMVLGADHVVVGDLQASGDLVAVIEHCISGQLHPRLTPFLCDQAVARALSDAVYAMHRGEYRIAGPLLIGLSDHFTDWQGAQLAIAEVLFRGGQAANAEPILRRIIACLPRWPVPFCLLGRVLMVLGRLSESEVEFRQCICLNPYWAEVRAYFAQCLQAVGDLLGAIEQIDVAIKLKPNVQQFVALRATLLSCQAA